MLTAVDITLNRAGAHPLHLELDPEQFTQQLMLSAFQAGQLYEAETSQLLMGVLSPGDTFVDVGAHVGYFSALAGVLVGATGHVFSFEPDPANYERLLSHARANHLQHLRPFNWAVGAAPAIASFFVNADNDGGHALWNVGRHPFNARSRVTEATRPVYVTSLDEALNGHPPLAIKAMKIDTEGNELHVVRGAQRILSEGQPLVVCEVNRFGLEQMGATEAELRAAFERLGYDAYAVINQSQLARLTPDQVVQTSEVFNLVFLKRGAEPQFGN